MRRVFYGWWIVLAAFLNFFFAVSIFYYGFPVFYASLIHSLGFTRTQVTQGFLIGVIVVGPLFGLLSGALIDRFGPREVIRFGIGFVGLSLTLMGTITRLWHYYALCVTLVLGYLLTGPIPNQVLISNWFQAKRGRAMGYVYVGAGLGGAAAPPLANSLIERFGWRHAFEIIGTVILLVLFPVAQWLTHSVPSDLGLLPDGSATHPFPSPIPSGSPTNSRSLGATEGRAHGQPTTSSRADISLGIAVRTANFWLLLAGSTLTIGAIGAVIQHLILFLRDQGYSSGWASRVSSALLLSSLAGRVTAGHFADRYSKKNVMAIFYLWMGLCVPVLFLARWPLAVWAFALMFGFAMGADFMLIPLVAAECFGLKSLGKLLALIISGYSVALWGAPWLAGKLFDTYHGYNLAWKMMCVSSLLGSAIVYAISSAPIPAGREQES
jgi:MFS transporter, OFA family, oxalate/formate antiporter